MSGLERRVRGLVVVAATAIALVAPVSSAYGQASNVPQQWRVFQADCNGVGMGVKPTVGWGPFSPRFFSGHRVFIPYRVQFHFFGDGGGLKPRHGITLGEAVV